MYRPMCNVCENHLQDEQIFNLCRIPTQYDSKEGKKLFELDWVCSNCNKGFEIIGPLKCTYEVCQRCKGKGRHTNPSIDGHGISQDEWLYEWSEEERRMYLSGAYDIPCEVCNGKRVIWTPHKKFTLLQICGHEIWAQYQKELDDYNHYQMMVEAERRMGA